MKQIQLIADGQGNAREVNPYPPFIRAGEGRTIPNKKCIKFSKNNKYIPILNPDNTLYLLQGPVMGGLEYQQSTFTNGWEEITAKQFEWYYKNHSELNQPVHKVRKVYIVSQPEKDKETVEEAAETAQPFEKFPELAKHIERMANTGQTGNMKVWGNFLIELNRVCDIEMLLSYSRGRIAEAKERSLKSPYPDKIERAKVVEVVESLKTFGTNLSIEDIYYNRGIDEILQKLKEIK